jgi:hypothetical protein
MLKEISVIYFRNSGICMENFGTQSKERYAGTNCVVAKHERSEEESTEDWQQRRCGYYSVQQVMLYGTRKNYEIRSELGIRKLDKQTHEGGGGDGCDINRGRHQKELQNNFYIKSRQEDVIQEDQEVGSMFEDGTG